MSINRYDTPAQAQFINTYSPIPFDEMMKIGLMKQAQREKTDELLFQNEAALNNIQVAPGDEEALRNKRASLLGELDNLSSQTGGFMGYAGTKELMRFRNKLMGDQDLREFSSNLKSYQETIKAKNDALEKGVPDSNQFEIDEVLKRFGPGGKGTLEQREVTGDGRVSAGSFMPYIPVRKEFAEMIKGVDERVTEAAGLKNMDGNKYIIETGNAVRTLEALGAPLGVAFKTNGKGGLVIDRENSNIWGMMDTPVGKQIQVTARHRAKDAMHSKDNEGKTYQEVLTTEIEKEYYDKAMSAINERVSSKSTISVDADSFDLAGNSQRLKDIGYDSSSNIVLATAATNLTDLKSIGVARNEETKKIQQLTMERDKLISQDNAKLEEYTDPVSKTVYKRYIDSTGKNITETVRSKQLDIEEANKRLTHMDDMVNGIKKRLGIPAEFTPTSLQEKAATKYADRAISEAVNTLKTIGIDPSTGTQLSDPKEVDAAIAQAQSKEQKEELVQEYYTNNTDYYKSLNQALKDNAGKSSYDTKVTRFGSEPLNKLLDGHFNTATANQAFFNTDGSEVSNKEKFNYGKLIFAASEDKIGEDGVWSEGPVWDNERGKYMVAYKVATGEKKNPVKTILTEAPSQIVSIMIDRGLTSGAQQIIQQQVSKLYADPNKEAKVYLGDENKPGTAFVRKLRTDELNLYGAEYILEYQAKEPDGTVRWQQKPFGDTTALGNFYEGYYNIMKQNTEGTK